MKSYRYYKPDSPMSGLGHAMFADDQESVKKFGDTLYTVDSSNLVDIREIIQGFFTGKYKKSYMIIFPQTLDPTHIAYQAEAWDIPQIVQWFIKCIAIPNNIKGVKTRDGAVVFDESIIERVG